MILRGLDVLGPAVARWSLDELRARFPEAPITTARVSNGAVVIDEKVGLVHETTTLGAFLAALQAGACDRYLMTRLAELPAALTAEVTPPRYSSNAPWQESNVWIGAAGTVSSLHRDLADNLHVQISGRKRFQLVSPDQSAGVYPHGFFDSVPNGCHVDLEHPDFARFPRLQAVNTFVAELEPGDAIYIPRRWWHHVRTLELSISANFWWARGVYGAVVAGAQQVKRLRRISR